MKKLIFASITLLLASSIGNQVIAADALNNTSLDQILSPTTVDINSQWWTGTDRYEISYIDGYREAYLSGEPIEFYVEGKSDKLVINKENGFYVSAALHNLTNPSAQVAIVNYDAGRNAWRVKLIAPLDTTKEYKVTVHLICGAENESPCSGVYAKGTRLDKELSFRFLDAGAQQ